MKKILLLIILLSFVFSKQNFDKKTSPILAMGLSAIIPGGGQFLNGDWEKGLIFLGVELISFNQKNKYNDIGENYISEYESYANEYWSADKWIKDFYLFKNPNYDIYKAFTNYGSDMQYCDQSNSENPLYCEDDNYLDIWDYSHGVNFTYNNTFYAHDEIASMYTMLCEAQMEAGGTCLLYSPKDINGDGILEDSNNDGIYDEYNTAPWVELAEDVNGDYLIDDDNNLVVIYNQIVADRDHHFYEGLGKYPEFFSGWVDATIEGSTLEVRNGYEIPWTDKKHEFQNLRNKSNREFDKEEVFLSIIFINHAVSMFDAFLTSVNRMKKYSVNSSYKYDRNLNLNGLELSVTW